MKSIANVKGIKLGHASDAGGITGFTSVLCEDGAVGSVAIFGGAPGTRETDLLKPSFSVSRVHGIFLTGGSAFGLNAAEGVVRYLEEKGVGFDTGVAKVPIVAGAVIFDLSVGDPKSRPTAEMAYQSCVNSAKGDSCCQSGNVGAGTGATVGKLYGPEFMMKSGLGNWFSDLGNFSVGAVMVVNAAGNVYDPATGEQLAGAYDRLNSRFFSKQIPSSIGLLGKNTTIGVVATDAYLTKEECQRVAVMAMGGLAQVIRPSFTPFDGDAIFVLAAGKAEREENDVPGAELRASLVSEIGCAAQDAVAFASVDAVKSARQMAGIPSIFDIQSDRNPNKKL